MNIKTSNPQNSEIKASIEQLNGRMQLVLKIFLLIDLDWEILALLFASVCRHTLKNTCNLNLSKLASKVGLKINEAKAKFILLNMNITFDFSIETELIGQVENCCYLLTFISNDRKVKTNFLSRIQKARQAFSMLPKASQNLQDQLFKGASYGCGMPYTPQWSKGSMMMRIIILEVDK